MWIISGYDYTKVVFYVYHNMSEKWKSYPEEREAKNTLKSNHPLGPFTSWSSKLFFDFKI